MFYSLIGTFAKDEKNLFKLLYMRDRSNEEKAEGEETQKLIELIQKTTGLDKKTAYFSVNRRKKKYILSQIDIKSNKQPPQNLIIKQILRGLADV